MAQGSKNRVRRWQDAALATATVGALASLNTLITLETDALRSWQPEALASLNALLWAGAAAAAAMLITFGITGLPGRRLNRAGYVAAFCTLMLGISLSLANLTTVALTPLILPLLGIAWSRTVARQNTDSSTSEDRVAALLGGKRYNAAFAELRSLELNGSAIAQAGQLIDAYQATNAPEQANHVRRYLVRELASAAPRTPLEVIAERGMPQSLGRYDLEGLLGKGAMGAVYLARDARINRSVALKVVNLEREFDASGLDAARARFFQEAESAGRLHHPDIVMVYDASEVDGRAYIAMEYVCGKPLSVYVPPGNALPVSTVVELIARAADALGYAHENNVIHRDIKPANLMYDVTENQLKIMDFGVAQLNDTVRTRTGLILGTPAYMSPEQLHGDTLSGHSDLFSLGVTLYELLIGEVPFKAQNVVEIARMVSTAKVVPATSLRPELPTAIDQIFTRVLAKDPADRYSSGWDLARALRQLVPAHAAESNQRIAAK